MELTKQHKALLGVLGVGVLAVIADRTLLNGASAPAAAAAELAVPIEARVQTSAVQVAPETDTVADRVAKYASQLGEVDATDVNGAFAPRDAEAKVPVLSSKSVFPTSGVVCIGHQSSDSAQLLTHFRGSIKLTSVILNPRPMAFISGEKLELNDTRTLGGKSTTECQHEVKLLEVHGPDRQAKSAGSVTVLIDGKHRVNLVIDR